jgi:hypothetical protein
MSHIMLFPILGKSIQHFTCFVFHPPTFVLAFCFRSNEGNSFNATKNPASFKQIGGCNEVYLRRTLFTNRLEMQQKILPVFHFDMIRARGRGLIDAPRLLNPR